MHSNGRVRWVGRLQTITQRTVKGGVYFRECKIQRAKGGHFGELDLEKGTSKTHQDLVAIMPVFKVSERDVVCIVTWC